MKILITGGAGFIGSHLAELLVAQQHEVVIYDNFSSGHWHNLDALAGRAAVHVGDCRNRNNLRDAARGAEFIYHLAASLGVGRVLRNHADCIHNNLDSTRNVLNLGVPGIFTSTSEVYGARTTAAFSEDSHFVYSSATRWSYAASKLIDEYLCLDSNWGVLRLFNIIGPRQSRDSGCVLPQFVSQALAGEPLTIYGDGMQTRCFLDVRDCVALLAALLKKSFNIVNIGSTEEYCIQTLALLVLATLQKPIRYTKVDYRDAYPRGFEECPRRVPDLSLLKSIIAVPPPRPLGETIVDIAAEQQLQLQSKETTNVRPETQVAELRWPAVRTESLRWPQLS